MTVTATPNEYLDARQPHWLDAERAGAVKYDALPRVVSITDPEIRRAFLVTVSAEIRAVVVGLVALFLTGCGAFGGGMYYPLKDMSAEQIKAAVSPKEAGLTCISAVYAGAKLTTVIVNSDRGVPAGISMSDDCKFTFDTKITPPNPALTVPMTITPQLSIGAPSLVAPPVQVVPAPRSEVPTSPDRTSPVRRTSPSNAFKDWLAQPTVDVRALLRDMPR